jgi:hypothetical protein
VRRNRHLISTILLLCLLLAVLILPVLVLADGQIADPTTAPMDPWRSLWKFATDNLSAVILGAAIMGYLFFDRYKVLSRVEEVEERAKENRKILNRNYFMLRAIIYKIFPREAADKLTGTIDLDGEDEDNGAL